MFYFTLSEDLLTYEELYETAKEII